MQVEPFNPQLNFLGGLLMNDSGEPAPEMEVYILVFSGFEINKAGILLTF